MSPKESALTIMAKMALADGEFVASERSMLRDLVESDQALDALLQSAKETQMDALLESLESYADRFFVALRSYAMAMVDEVFDAREEALYNTLLEQLKITDEDQALIEQSQKAALDNQPPDERVLELYEASSFSKP